MSSGSGSDPHLFALLRAIRLRQAAPDAAAAGAADAEAAFAGGAFADEAIAELPGPPGPSGAPDPHGPFGPPGLPRPPVDPPHELPPVPPRPGLLAAPAHHEAPDPAAPGEQQWRSPAEAAHHAGAHDAHDPAHEDTFAEILDAEILDVELPPAHPAGHAFRIPAADPADVQAAAPGSGPLYATGYRAGVGPVPSRPAPPSSPGTPGSPPDPGSPTPPVNPSPSAPGSGTPGSGTPGSGTPGSGTPGSGTPGSGTPGSGTPGSGTPASGPIPARLSFPADGGLGSYLDQVDPSPGVTHPADAPGTPSPSGRVPPGANPGSPSSAAPGRRMLPSGAPPTRSGPPAAGGPNAAPGGPNSPIRVPVGLTIPALRGIQPTARPAPGTDPPATTGRGALGPSAPGDPAAPTHPAATTHPPAPMQPPTGRPTAPAGRPAPPTGHPAPPTGHPAPPNGLPSAPTGRPGALPPGPNRAGVIPAPFGGRPEGLSGRPHQIIQASISPIPGIPGALPPGRPVPGSYPEAPNPALLAAALRQSLPPHGPAAGSPTPGSPADGMNPADDAALREVQRLLSNSLSMAGGPADVAVRLRAALAQAQPQLLATLPGGAQTQSEQLAEALTWLVHNLNNPPVVAAGCGRLGAALAECGVQPGQMQLVGAALAEAMRAGLGAAWRQEMDQAWRTTWQHAYEWIVHGEAQIAYQPTIWAAEVVSHERRRDDLAVVRFRPYLPMPFRPGQYARIEVPELPGVWRPYSLSGQPRRDNLIELHVRAKTTDGVSGTLVYRTEVGDRVRFARAEGTMGLHQHPERDLLMIAGDTGVAPLKALLTELADTADPRSAVLFWGVRNLAELYDIEEIADLARAARRATVIPVISEGEAGPYASGLVTDAVAAYGEWSGHEVYLAGPPTMLAATSAALQLLGVDPDRIHHDAPEG